MRRIDRRKSPSRRRKCGDVGQDLEIGFEGMTYTPLVRIHMYETLPIVVRIN
jgi:hypothetical protein